MNNIMYGMFRLICSLLWTYTTLCHYIGPDLERIHNPDRFNFSSPKNLEASSMFTEVPVINFEKEVDAAISRLYQEDKTFFESGIDFFGAGSAIAMHAFILNTKAAAIKLGVTERERLYALHSVQQAPSFMNLTHNDLVSTLSGAFSESSRFRGLFQDAGKCPEEEAVTCDPNSKFRTADGSCNNLKHPRWGRSFICMRRFMPAEYNDGVSSPRSRGKNGLPLPNSRMVSRSIHTSDEGIPESTGMSHMVMQWGQFIDHDITSTPIHKGQNQSIVRCCVDDIPRGTPANIINELVNRDVCMTISIPANDKKFKNRTCMNFVRSIQVANTECRFDPVEQLNQITAFIDGSQVYGSSDEEHDALQLHDKGLMKFYDDNLLPGANFQNCIPEEKQDFCFIAGDERVNEQMGLTSIHTVWMREHNRIARTLGGINPHWDDKRLYQETRKIIGALIQKITYEEFLPMLLNDDTRRFFNLVSESWGYKTVYNENTDPSIRNSFATAAYRLGHTLIRGTLSQLSSPFSITGTAKLETLFGNTSYILRTKGESISWLLGGMTRDHSMTFDRFLSTEITENLFLDRDGNSLDLATLNIQRGRDHGLPGYNTYRRWCNLREAQHFGTGTGGLQDHSADSARILGTLYSHPDDIDLFPGVMSERSMQGGIVGPTVACIIGMQFQMLKEGDRFWYETGQEPVRFSLGQLHTLRSSSLARILCDNTNMPLMQAKVMETPDFFRNPILRCTDLPTMDFSYWKELPPLWGTWSQWTLCDDGIQRRYRQCTTGSDGCVGRNMEERRCAMFPFTSASVWTKWASWSPCTNNRTRRTRMCVRNFNPVHTCIGDDVQVMPCIGHTFCPFAEYSVAQSACLRMFVRMGGIG